MPRTRRSNRQSGPRTKYTNDPFEIAGVSDESNAEDANPSRVKGKRVATSPPQDSSSDEEFKDDGNGREENSDENEDDDDEEMIPDEEDDEDDASGSDGDAMSIDGEDARAGPGKKNQKKPLAAQPTRPKQRNRGPAMPAPGETHSRGVWNPSEHVGKVEHLRVTYGTDERDLLNVVHARDQWSGGADSTVPTRSSLNRAQKASGYKYGLTFGAEPEDMKRERTRGWDWYYADDIGERFRKRQRIAKTSEDEARGVYMPLPKEQDHTILIGPVDGDQSRFQLAQHESLNFGDAWDEGKSSARPKKKKRQGWIINLGQRIKNMAWAPNQPGLTQYLTVAAPIREEQKKAYGDPSKSSAPAFTPSPPYPCALQLWMFKAAKEESFTKTLDMTFKPRLRLALCTDWGDLKRMAWCPMARDPRDEDEEDDLRNVGLLAGIWGDGYLRVIDVKLSRNPTKTEFLKVQSPVFEAKAPSTVGTALTWLSPSDIAVGCANGFVAAWSIAPIQASQAPPNPLPFFYQPIHSTYILTIASSYPTNPHLLATTSMDGETRLWSLIDHNKNMVETNRMRVGSAHLSYSPMLQAFVSGDENDFARLLAVRRFFTTSAIARLQSTITALAPCSSWHPSTLYGSAGGSVVATNPLKRVLHPKEKQLQQTWFTHEWVRGTEADSPGTSRFFDGFLAESASLLRNMSGDRKMMDGTMIITLYDEETHVTSISWNPNQACAGWATAAVGCGLIRIEDLAM
ncbi:transcription factor TFIIIC subunit TFC6 [Aspergillus affinis]|uniref:transcription factor TFIIIC subunit TFC6 n=1 Tax=Aspergillus affinis TaxID=1070780 RepID=UPI0022FEE532|nr:putative transcription factor TFIIIC complex subunit Tfc6 [Aspergillus affinis]KAI9044421.1 putative transcription factor TFIIIC complex subunit Tfc6 [Aspergillus affinis]